MRSALRCALVLLGLGAGRLAQAQTSAVPPVNAFGPSPTTSSSLMPGPDINTPTGTSVVPLSPNTPTGVLSQPSPTMQPSISMQQPSATIQPSIQPLAQPLTQPSIGYPANSLNNNQFVLPGLTSPSNTTTTFGTPSSTTLGIAPTIANTQTPGLNTGPQPSGVNTAPVGASNGNVTNGPVSNQLLTPPFDTLLP